MATSTLQAPPDQLQPQTDVEAKALAKVTKAAGTAEARIAEKDAESARKLRERKDAVDLARAEAQLKRDERNAKAEDREAQRTRRRSDRAARRKARTDRAVRAVLAVHRFLSTNAPAAYSSVIYAVALGVAVSGQISVATERGWNPLFGVGMAVFLEGLALSMALTAHQLRLQNERALIPTAMTWVAAGFASGINVFAHRADPVMAAILGASSLAAIIVWEVRSGAKHRKVLRDKGWLPEPPERFGPRRWLRFPRETWDAWSLDVKNRVSVGAALLIEQARSNRAAVAAATSAGAAQVAQIGATLAFGAAAREAEAARTAARGAKRAAELAAARGPKRSLRSRFKRTAKDTETAPAAAPEPPKIPAAPVVRAKPRAKTAPPPPAARPETTETPRAADFTAVEHAFVELYIASGKRPGSRLIAREVAQHPGAPKKTAIGDWLSANPGRVAALTARADKLRAARADAKEPTA